MRCEGKVAIVTGAAGDGIGRSVALTLAREGAQVVVNYRSSSRSGRALVAHIERQGGKAIAVEADIFQAEGCKKLVQATLDPLSRVDICVIGPGADWHGESIDKLDPAAALQDVCQEVAPPFYLMPLLLPGMYAQKWGRIIGIALLPSYDSPAYAFGVAKAARAQALLRARDQAWEHGVTINVIGPGPLPMIENLETAAEQCGHGPAWQQRATASPQDIAEGVAFLCSEAARFITGCVLPYMFCK